MTTRNKGLAIVTGTAVGVVGMAAAAVAASDPAAATSIAGGAATTLANVLNAANQGRASDPGALQKDRQIPVRDYRVSAGWGHSSGPHAGREHGGIDFAARIGEKVYAAEDGRVVQAGYNGGYGKSVTIELDSGKRLIYGHLSRIAVNKGNRIHAGAKLGRVGSTGYSTGPHLHFEVRNTRDKAINPNTYLGKGRPALMKLEHELTKYDRKGR